jgi:acetolactate synthase I/II/III large subunit
MPPLGESVPEPKQEPANDGVVMSEGVTTADVVVNALAAAGIRHVFAYPGDPIIDLMDRMRNADIEVILARREGTGAFMAEAAAASTGGLGVCMSTLGPGSTALLNGVAAATLDRVPMLALSGQIESAREPFFTHQVVDHKLLYSPVTKWAGRLEPGSVGTVMRKAMRLATAERPGAVHLSIPADASSQLALDNGFTMPPTEPAVTASVIYRAAGRPGPDRLLAAARRPVLLAGIAAVRSGASAALTRLAETVSMPVVVAPMAKGVFAEDHPLFAGVLDMACDQVVWELLDSADLIVAVGFDAVELIRPWQTRTPMLHIDTTANTDQIYASECECVGAIGSILDWLSDDYIGEPRWSSAEVGKHRDRLRNAYYEGRVSGALNPTDVVDTVRAAMPRGAIATCDVGSHKLLIGQGWTAYQPRGTLMTNGLSAMGFGLPAAIAAKLVRPEDPVVALIGDGGFAMTATELRLAAALKLPIVVVVFVDGSLNRIELKQVKRNLPSTATRIEEMDLVMMAVAMDCDGVRVDTAAEVVRALSDHEQLSRPLVIEAHINPSQYESQF